MQQQIYKKIKKVATNFNPDGPLDESHDTVDIVAVADFKTETQQSTDHLTDEEDIAQDEGPSHQTVSSWNCQTNEDVPL